MREIFTIIYSHLKYYLKRLSNFSVRHVYFTLFTTLFLLLSLLTALECHRYSVRYWNQEWMNIKTYYPYDFYIDITNIWRYLSLYLFIVYFCLSVCSFVKYFFTDYLKKLYSYVERFKLLTAIFLILWHYVHNILFFQMYVFEYYIEFKQTWLHQTPLILTILSIWNTLLWVMRLIYLVFFCLFFRAFYAEHPDLCRGSVAYSIYYFFYEWSDDDWEWDMEDWYPSQWTMMHVYEVAYLMFLVVWFVGLYHIWRYTSFFKLKYDDTIFSAPTPSYLPSVFFFLFFFYTFSHGQLPDSFNTP